MTEQQKQTLIQVIQRAGDTKFELLAAIGPGFGLPVAPPGNVVISPFSSNGITLAIPMQCKVNMRYRS